MWRKSFQHAAHIPALFQRTQCDDRNLMEGTGAAMLPIHLTGQPEAHLLPRNPAAVHVSPNIAKGFDQNGAWRPLHVLYPLCKYYITRFDC